MSTSPLTKYQQLIQSGKFQADAQQELAIHELERIYHGLLPRLKKKIFKNVLQRYYEPVKGLYIWGDVGIGKTWLMDLFCDSLPDKIGLRIHFYQFMQLIHKKLTELQGEPNPLNVLARRFSKQYRVLCFDEFFVSDITDAVVLAGLLKALFSYGISLVTTSNMPPDLLYKGGINRERFLPAIDLINTYTQVLHLPTHKDYRLEKFSQAKMYCFPITDMTLHEFNRHFKLATDDRYIEDEILKIEERDIITIAAGRGVVWFDFNVLCNIPRSQVDYIEIAKLYETVFLSNVPQFNAAMNIQVINFIKLIDVFYDMKTKLVILAECSIDDLYSVGSYKFEFQRTKSRLHEMRTRD